MPYSCSICHKEYKYSSSLKLHSRNKHNAPKKTAGRPKIYDSVSARQQAILIRNSYNGRWSQQQDNIKLKIPAFCENNYNIIKDIDEHTDVRIIIKP